MSSRMILLAEDEPDLREWAAGVLAGAGYQVIGAATGSEAWALAQAQRPALVVSDVLMPGMDGYQLLLRLRDTAGLSEIPVILYSGTFSEQEALRVARRLGVSCFLSKPFSGEALLAAVAAALRRESAGPAAPPPGVAIDYGQVLVDKLAQQVKDLEAYENRFRRSERLLHGVVETTSSLIVVCDSEGRILLFNRACEELTGYRRGEVFGRTIAELFLPPEWVQVVQRQFADPLSEEARAPHVNPWRTRAGDLRNIEWRCTVLPSLADGDHLILGTGVDITERMQAEAAVRRSEERLTNLIEIAVDAIIATDENQRIVIFNKGAEAIFGYSRTEVLGQSLSLLLPLRYATIHGHHMRQFAAGPEPARLMGARREVFGRRKDGTEFPAEASISKQTSGGQVLFTAILRDITERKQSEQEISSRALQQAAVAELSRLALTSSPLKAVLDDAAVLVARSLRADHCMILQFDGARNSFRWAAYAGWDSGLALRTQIPAGLESQASYTLAASRSVVVEDVLAECRFAASSLFRDHQVRSGISGLIGGMGQPWGVLGVHCRVTRKFAPGEVKFVETACNVLAEIIRHQRAQKELQDYSVKLGQLSQQLIGAQELERRRVARELHDHLGQSLALIQIHLQAAQGLIGSGRLERALEETIAMVDHLHEQVRDLSLDLRPSILDDLGLVPALRWHVDRLVQSSGLPIRFEADPGIGRCGMDLETTCFRVAQEALSNVLRHAQAAQAGVTLRDAGQELILRISDDGRGFDPRAARQQAARGRSLGLLSMEERMNLVGGTLAIESSASEGTTICARFPLPSGAVAAGPSTMNGLL